MSFHVGQKVVCVVGRRGNCGDVAEPVEGDVATVSNVYVAEDDTLILELVEFPAPESDEHNAGWLAEFFRPIVSRKTDISALKALLVPGAKIRETA